jgi:hypothetical protein
VGGGNDIVGIVNEAEERERRDTEPMRRGVLSGRSSWTA